MKERNVDAERGENIWEERSGRCLQVGTLSTPLTTLHSYPHLPQAVIVIRLAHYT